ncbi:MAG: 50S ribosomal protein L11 methyltransferase [Chloroflexi bacterium]|nr:50S ribosomal protein L11 methyltransferase [Chloroflexota bacterium]
MSGQWAAISVPLRPEALDDVSLTLHRLVGASFAVETRAPSVEGAWPVTAHAYLAPGTGQAAARRELLRALEMLRIAGDGVVGAASEAFVDADGYRTRWREFHAPMAVGRRMVIVPAWLDQPPDQADRIPIFLDSAMAFGTGRHPTTQLALAALEGSLTPGDVVVDVGTGSGVLAIAAAKLGAARVYAFDRDAEAGPAATANVQRNAVADRVALTIPSTTLNVPEPAALVVANIVASVHLKLLREYASLLLPEGRLLLGGVLDARVEDVVGAARRFGFRLTSTAAADEWRLLDFTMSAALAAPPESEHVVQGSDP